MVGRAHRLAVGGGFEHGQDLAVPVGLQHIGPELVADPEGVADDLKTFGVEIGAGEITLCRVLMHDTERHLLVGIVQEDGFLALDLAGRPVDLVPVQVQHRIRRVVARAHAVVGEHPERAVRHHLDAGMALQRLALERQRHAGRALVGFAHHAADGVDALAGGVFARGLEIVGRIGGRIDKGLRRQHGVALQRGGKLAFALRKGGSRPERRKRRSRAMTRAWRISS